MRSKRHRGKSSLVRTALLFLLPLTGCSQTNPLIAKCETAIKARMASPSTYRRISVESEGPDSRFVYEASNAFGAPIQRHGLCSPTGKTVTWRSTDPIQMSEGAGSTDKPIGAAN